MLAGRKVCIVGGSYGMGYATAEHVLRAGATVAIAARTPDRLEEAATRLERNYGRSVGWRALSIEDRAAVRKWLADEAPIDHLVLPGSTVKPVLFDDLTEEVAQESFSSKFWGPLWATFDARPHLVSGGSVVLFSGVAAQRPVRGYIIGACINGALEAAVRSLALELGRSGLRINAIAPGFIRTPLFDLLHDPEDFEQRYREACERLPVGRVGSPDEAALGAVYLMMNGFVTGQILTIDGGHVVTE